MTETRAGNYSAPDVLLAAWQDIFEPRCLLPELITNLAV